MSDEKEKVADVAAEIRRLNPETFIVSKWCRAPMPDKMRSYADRFDEAHKRETARLLDENARLRAALEPVLACKVLSAMSAEIGPGESDYCSNIIFKAQRIYNEGGEGEAEK